MFESDGKLIKVSTLRTMTHSMPKISYDQLKQHPERCRPVKCQKNRRISNITNLSDVLISFTRSIGLASLISTRIKSGSPQTLCPPAVPNIHLIAKHAYGVDHGFTPFILTRHLVKGYCDLHFLSTLRSNLQKQCYTNICKNKIRKVST
jgi:hypothetical protein